MKSREGVCEHFATRIPVVLTDAVQRLFWKTEKVETPCAGPSKDVGQIALACL